MHPHHRIKLNLATSPNRFGKECYKPMKLSSVWLLKGYESIHLARQTIKYFDIAEQNSNNTQLDALSDLNAWIVKRTKDIFTLTQSSDFDKVIPGPEMRYLLRLINILFFGRDLSSLHFSWVSGPSDDNGTAHRYTLLYNKIEMNTTDVVPKPSILTILGTLLHEAVHVHLNDKGCEKCVTSDRNIMPNGHGRAWQLLAAKVESAFSRFTGLPVDLHRYGSIRVYWDEYVPLPSLHDLQDWDLGRELLSKFCMSSMTDAFEKSGQARDFSIKAFGTHWWGREPRVEVIDKGGKSWFHLLLRVNDRYVGTGLMVEARQ